MNLAAFSVTLKIQNGGRLATTVPGCSKWRRVVHNARHQSTHAKKFKFRLRPITRSGQCDCSAPLVANLASLENNIKIHPPEQKVNSSRPILAIALFGSG